MKLAHLPLIKQCKRILRLFKFKLRRPVLIRSLGSRLLRFKTRKAGVKGHYNKVCREAEGVTGEEEHYDKTWRGLEGVREVLDVKAPHPSPVTPAYIEMIVEEGKLMDLVDVEDLLHCWKNLKSPFFIHLVCTFYRELCKDLFSP